MGICTGYFTGDLYIHGMNTKFKPNDFYGMPMVVHAPAGSYAAKCADAGTFNAKSPTFLGRGTTISEGFCVVLVCWLTHGLTDQHSYEVFWIVHPCVMPPLLLK